MSGTQARRAWYAITLDRVLVVLLVVVGLLFLSDQYDWFAFNRRKGWTVLIAVAVVSGVLSLTGLWTLLNWMMSRWIKVKPFQFGLRSGLVLVAVVGLVCGWLGGAIRHAQQQAEICAAIGRAKGGIVRESWGTPDHVPQRVAGLLGADFFLKVEEASAIDDEGLLQIVRLSEVEILNLDGWVLDEKEASDFSHLTDGTLRFSTAALSKIQFIPGLKRLQLDAKELTAPELASLNLPNTLEELKLVGDNLDDSTLGMIGKLQELRELKLDLSERFVYISHAPKRTLKITDSGLQHLAGLAKLRKLELSNTSLTDGALVHLQLLGELRELAIDDAELDGSGFRQLEALSNLESLDVSSNKIVDDNLKLLQELPNLKSLDLRYTDVGDVGLEHVAQLQQLESLLLRWPKATRKGFLHLKQLKGLKRLDVAIHWTAPPDRDWIKVISELDQLEELELSGNELDDNMWSELHSLKRLKYLRTGIMEKPSPGLDALKSALPQCNVRSY